MRRILFSIALLGLAGCACPASSSHFSPDGTTLTIKGERGMAAPVVVSDYPCNNGKRAK